MKRISSGSYSVADFGTGSAESLCLATTEGHGVKQSGECTDMEWLCIILPVINNNGLHSS
jgi:hypothetical protein